MAKRTKPDFTKSDLGVAARRVALDVMERIGDGAYANLVLGPALDASYLDARDRNMVTNLVYGVTRMRRSCDFLVDRHRKGKASRRVMDAMRLGAYQLAYTETAPYAAVAATVAAAPKPARGLVNAVLRRVAEDLEPGRGSIPWPSEAVELSYPDWIVTEFRSVLGDQARDALAAMNMPAITHRREDGYVQDLTSQQIGHLIGARPGQRILDMCAAPGGKATYLAATGAQVVAADVSINRGQLIVDNVARLDQTPGPDLSVLVADATNSPFPSAVFDLVLVDAPCSGLGVLRRRPDARWRIDKAGVDRLVEIQKAALSEAFRVVKPGGQVWYSVCTLTRAETDGVIDSIAEQLAQNSDPIPVESILRELMVPTPEQDGMFVQAWRRCDQ